MPAPGLICLTPASELRQLLNAGRRRVVVTFRFYHCDYYRDVTIVAVKPADNGIDRVDCMLRNGDVITLLVPAQNAGRDNIDIANPGRIATIVLDLNRPAPLHVLALEQHLRWQQEQLLWGRQDSSDDRPYAQHPCLGELARAVRQQIADCIGEGRVVGAVVALRAARPEMSLRTAATVIEALSLDPWTGVIDVSAGAVLRSSGL